MSALPESLEPKPTYAPSARRSGKVIPFPVNARTHAVTSPRLAVVVAYANPDGQAETSIDEQVGGDLVDALRHQIVSLAEHYAKDVTELSTRNDALGTDNAALKTENIDAWRQVARWHVTAANAQHDAAGASQEADDLAKQVREQAMLISQMRNDLMLTGQRAKLLEQAAHCRFYERGSKRELLDAANQLK